MTTATEKFATRLKFTPDGKQVLVSDLGTGDLLILDAAKRRELKRISLGRPHASAAAGRDPVTTPAGPAGAPRRH